MTQPPDKTDLRILSILQEDASLTAAEIGDRVSLSQAACWKRIKRLESDGIIEKRVAILAPEKIGLGTLILVHVKLSAHGRANLDDITAKVRAMPKVLECYVLLGNEDFFLKIAVADIYEYEQFFFRELSSINGVAEIKSTVTLSRIKDTTAFPLPH